MRIRNTSRFLFASTTTSRRGHELEMVAVVRASFQLTEGRLERLYVEKGSPMPQGMLRGDGFLPGDHEGAGELTYASDFAEWKPRADVLLRGHAYAPGAAKVAELGVRLAVGRWSKAIRVVGDRRWRDRGGTTDPVPFASMPIDWLHAWGGPGDPRNPVGRGETSMQVPNLEAPDEPITDRGRPGRPVAFAPVNPRWPVRALKMGTRYDGAWARERAPWYASDLDWTHFNAAPDDQQIEGYLRGDEDVQIQNMLPTRPLLATRLPAVRPRVFGRRWSKGGKAGPADATFELPMVLDTLFFDLIDEKVVLTWRGLAPVDRQDREDVPFVFVTEEPLAGPARTAEHLAALEAFAADPTDRKAFMTAEMAALSGEKPGAVALPATDDGVVAVDALLGKRFGPLADPHRAQVRDFLRRSLTTLASQPSPPGAAAAGAATGAGPVHAALVAAAAKAAQPPRAPAAVGGGAQPSVRLRESVQQIEAAARAAQRDLASQSRRPRALSQVANLSKDERLRALDPSLEAAGGRKKDPEPGAGVTCKGGNYQGRSFDGQDLRGVDFTDCLLAGASFRGAKMRGARLERALAVDADFTDAELDDAVFLRSNASRARFEGASLERARFEHATLEEADLRRVRARFVRLDEAILRAARFDDAVLGECLLRKSVLNEASFQRVDLGRSRIEGCLFISAVLRGAQLAEAVVTDTAFQLCELERASFERATVAGCSFVGSKMAGANLRGALAKGAMFLDADLTGAQLRGADLRNARFADALLRKADLGGADVFRADFSRTQLDEASFRGANAYGAFFWDAAGQRASFEGANLERSLPERS